MSIVCITFTEGVSDHIKHRLGGNSQVRIDNIDWSVHRLIIAATLIGCMSINILYRFLAIIGRAVTVRHYI